MIVLDANILIRAVLGRRVRQLIETQGHRAPGSLLRTLPSTTQRVTCLPCSRNEVSRMSMCRHHSNICGTSSSQLTARSTASLKARRGSACVVAMKTIGQCWLPRLGWHVRYGRKMQTSSEPASRRGQQIASRFFSRRKQSQPDPRRAENPNRPPPRQEKFCANDVIPAYENYYKRVLDES